MKKYFNYSSRILVATVQKAGVGFDHPKLDTLIVASDLKEYFIATGRVQLEEKKMNMKKSTDSLGVMAEMYTILLIVFPLMAVIMLSIMAIMSPDLAGFDLITLMNLMTYVMVPFFGFLMLFMMDSMVPKR